MKLFEILLATKANLVLLHALLLDKVSHRETLLTIDLLYKVVAQVAVVRVQLTNLHGAVGNVWPLVCASRFGHFSNWVARYLALATMQLIFQPIVWPSLCVALKQRSARLPRHHLRCNLLPSSYLSNPIYWSFSVLNGCLPLSALLVGFVCDGFEVLVEISTSTPFGLARLGDVRVRWILGIELLMRHQRVNSFFEFLIKMLLRNIY